MNGPTGSGFLEKLRAGLDRCEVGPGGRLLVALSGGTDSTALLLGIAAVASEHTSPLKIEAAHFDHGLRGDRSAKDLEYCKKLCVSRGITLHTGSGDVRSYASDEGLSVEAAARDLRYRFFAELVAAHRFDAIVTGHTQDDQAETVLLALTRGAGLRGASGMDYITVRKDLSSEGLTVLRPMLAISRTETERFCEISGVEPLQDESNADVAYSRNRIRRDVIPALKEINTEASAAIARFAENARDGLALIDEIASAELKKVTIESRRAISKSEFRQLSQGLQSHVFMCAYLEVAGTLWDLDANTLQSAVRAACELDSGRVDLPNGVALVIEHHALRLLAGGTDSACPYPQSVGNQKLGSESRIEFGEGVSLASQIVRPMPDPASLSKWQAVLDMRAVAGEEFSVRTRRPGDRFHALGMNDEMKLQDFLVNQHVPERWRDRVPLVTTRRGICWVVGERIAEWAKVSDGAEAAVLLEYSPHTDL